MLAVPGAGGSWQWGKQLRRAGRWEAARLTGLIGQRRGVWHEKASKKAGARTASGGV